MGHQITLGFAEAVVDIVLADINFPGEKITTGEIAVQKDRR